MAGRARIRYTGALATSLLVHASVVALLVLITTRHIVPTASPTEELTTVAVLELPPDISEPQFEREEQERLAEPSLAVAGFNFDVDKIARRRHLLFPLIGDDVAVDALARAAEEHANRPLTNPFARAGARTRVALSLSAQEVQGVVDRAWSRSERWNAFREIAALTDRHDPNDDTLALVLRKYVDENLLQPFDDVSAPDPRLWVELTIAADLVDFLDYIATYVRQYSGTKAATELLFLLDELIQSNHDGLATLLKRTPDADLQFTRTANRDAFELLSTIHTYQQRAVADAGLTSRAAVAQRFDYVRLMVLSTILATAPEGYRTDDARFLAGEVHWKAGRHDDAVRPWRDMRPDPEDAYFLAALRVQEAIATTPPDQQRVRSALRDQEGRWWVSSVARLRQFGYRPDRY